MKPYIKELGLFSGWRELDGHLLREMLMLPFGTVFILQTLSGKAHLCKMLGNLPTDEHVKAQRMSDFKFIRLEMTRPGALVCILPNAQDQTRPAEPLKP